MLDSENLNPFQYVLYYPNYHLVLSSTLEYSVYIPEHTQFIVILVWRFAERDVSHLFDLMSCKGLNSHSREKYLHGKKLESELTTTR